MLTIAIGCNGVSSGRTVNSSGAAGEVNSGSEVGSTKVRWPTTVTLNPNAHSKFKSLTTNSKHSRQIQITLRKLQIVHSRLKTLTVNYKSFTANYKLLTLPGVFSHLQPVVQDV